MVLKIKTGLLMVGIPGEYSIGSASSNIAQTYLDNLNLDFAYAHTWENREVPEDYPIRVYKTPEPNLKERSHYFIYNIHHGLNNITEEYDVLIIAMMTAVIRKFNWDYYIQKSYKENKILAFHGLQDQGGLYIEKEDGLTFDENNFCIKSDDQVKHETISRSNLKVGKEFVNAGMIMLPKTFKLPEPEDIKIVDYLETNLYRYLFKYNEPNYINYVTDKSYFYQYSPEILS